VCVLKLKAGMENIFIKLLNNDLVYMTKPKNNKLISYGCYFDVKLVYSLAWIYKYYFEENVVLIFPKIINVPETLAEFNRLVGEYPLSTEDVIYGSLETLENLKKGVVIFGFADFIFNDLCILNKRRLLTCIKNLKSRVHVLSYTCLKCLDIQAFDNFVYYEMGQFLDFDFNYIDFESIEEFVQENACKKIYISLPSTSRLSEITFEYSRVETGTPGVVIQGPKTIERGFLKHRYDIYIFITRFIEYPIDLLYYIKEVEDSEVYLDSSRVKGYTKLFRQLVSQQINERLILKDSDEFDTYQELNQKLQDGVIVSEGYYRFNASAGIKQFDLQNLSKREYDTIRNFVKTSLIAKMNIEIKTCQLSAPCSPRDRARKLNSLANKISSYDYRCDATCQIFNDYTIGVVVWNETFRNRKQLDIEKQQSFIYQTTSGTWKYTKIN
jgi:hypothetical protein